VLNRLSNHGDVSTLPTVELGVLGPLQVRLDDVPVSIPGAKPRAILTMLGLYCHSVVSADTLVELLWGGDPPRTAGKALQTHISSLRHTLGDGFVLTEGTGWTVSATQIDAAQDAALDTPVSQHIPAVTRAVTFLLTDIEGSTAAWEADADAMAVALARHDELVEQVVTSRGGRLIKTRGEGRHDRGIGGRPLQ
jgi:hypothetical protein